MIIIISRNTAKVREVTQVLDHDGRLVAQAYDICTVSSLARTMKIECVLVDTDDACMETLGKILVDAKKFPVIEVGTNPNHLKNSAAFHYWTRPTSDLLLIVRALVGSAKQAYARQVC